MSIVDAIKKMLRFDPAPPHSCWKCRVRYVHEWRTIVMSDRFGYEPPRTVLMEVCPKCDGAGWAVPPPEPEIIHSPPAPMPGVTWRKVGEAWPVEDAR